MLRPGELQTVQQAILDRHPLLTAQVRGRRVLATSGSTCSSGGRHSAGLLPTLAPTPSLNVHDEFELDGLIHRQVAERSCLSLFRQYKRIGTQHYGDGRKDNSRCKLRDLFYFWCGLLLAWRRRQRRWVFGWVRR